MRQIRVLLIEDHFLARVALRAVLSESEQISVAGEACDGDEGLTMYRALHPDVLVLDLRLPRLSGFEVISILLAEFPKARIVVLSNYQGSEDIHRAVRSGVMSYLTKDASGEQLITAIESADRGVRYLPGLAVDRLAERIPKLDLTPRESEVLSCIAHGRSNREIANRLGIAEKTVRLHVSSVLNKMGVRDRTQATIYALQHGFVHLD
jgi:DNA-binding NarL/FixJ family response regulator